MGADKVVLQGGYEGADSQARKIADTAGTMQGVRNKQRAAGEDFLGSQSGALATQGSNSSLAGADAMGATAHDQATGAEGIARHVKHTAQSEAQNAGQQKQHVTNNLDVTSSVLKNSINK